MSTRAFPHLVSLGNMRNLFKTIIRKACLNNDEFYGFFHDRTSYIAFLEQQQQQQHNTTLLETKTAIFPKCYTNQSNLCPQLHQ